ncbi:MAG: ABC transporter substrate-binding protein [Myxococcales bacterium]|nr:ABC transporter substrate-binding protein [Myxococcales bacterium]
MRPRRRIRACWLPALIALCFACAPGPAAPPPAAAPARIVSLLPSFTQIVVALGAGDRVVGRTPFCPTAGLSPQAVEVGAALDANYERIFALRPDLVLVKSSMQAQRERLVALGLPVLALPTETIADAYTAIAAIAEKLGRVPAGQALVERLQNDLQTVTDHVKKQPPARTLLVIGHNPGELRGIFAAAKGTFLDELLTIAGGANALLDSPIAYPQLGQEEILRLDPEAIVALLPGADDSPAAQERERALWRALPYLRAVKADRVFLIADPDAVTSGLRMAEIARRMAALLHPVPEPPR